MRRLLKPLVFLLCLVPLAGLVFIVLTGRTSANPAEDIQLTTGIWAFRFLLGSLAITPIRRLTGWNAVIRYRRDAGVVRVFLCGRSSDQLPVVRPAGDGRGGGRPRRCRYRQTALYYRGYDGIPVDDPSRVDVHERIDQATGPAVAAAAPARVRQRWSSGAAFRLESESRGGRAGLLRRVSRRIPGTQAGLVVAAADWGDAARRILAVTALGSLSVFGGRPPGQNAAAPARPPR